MGFFDFIPRAKKKLTDAIGGGLSDVANGFKDELSKAKTYMSTPVSQDSGWNKVDSGMRSFSQSAENVPKFTFDDTASWKTPVKKLATTIAQPIVNIPSRTIKGAFKDYGVKPTVSNVIKRSADAANIGLDAGGLMGGGSTAKKLVKDGFDVAKPAFKKIVAEGAKTGAKQGLAYGTGAGVMQGLQEGDTVTDQVKNAGKRAVEGGVMGAVGGAVLGGAVPAVGYGAKKVVNEAKLIGKDVYNFQNPYSKKIVPQTTQTMDGPITTPKDPNTVSRLPLMGNKGRTPNGEPGYKYPGFQEPVFVDTVKTPFVPQSATGKFIMSPKAGMGIEDVTRGQRPPIVPTNKNTQEINAINERKNAEARAALEKLKKETPLIPPKPAQSPSSNVTVGSIVRNEDRGNIGTVLNINDAGEALVSFVNKKDKTHATVRIPLQKLTHIGGKETVATPMSDVIPNTPLVPNMASKSIPPVDPVEAFRRSLDETPPSSPVSNVEQDLATMKKDGTLAKTADTLFGPYNQYQQRAFDKKQERIGAIGEVSDVPNVLRAMGFKKNEVAKLGVEESKKIAALGRLGYSKKDPIMADVNSEFVSKILEHSVQHKTLKQFYTEKHALDTHYLDGIDPADLKDISPVASGWRDMYRNLEVAFGKHFPKIKAQLLDKFDEAKGNYIDEQKTLLKNFDENIVSGLGIKKGSELSAAVQLYGEKKVSLEEIKQQFPKDWEKIVEADNWFRDTYTKLLADLNRVREANFPTHPLYPESTKQIQMRSDYYRHFQEMQDGFPALKNILSTSSSIDPALAVSSEHTKPKTKWLSMAQQRTGDTSTIDAVGGFLDYLKAYSYAKNIDPFIQKFRGVDGEIKDATPYPVKRIGLAEELSTKMDPVQQIAILSDPAAIKQILTAHGASDAQSEWMSKELATMDDVAKVSTFLKEKFAKNSDKIFEKMVPSAAANVSENKLNNTLKFLDNFANNLAGKSNPIDRPFQDMFLGRTMFKAINWLNSRIKANVLLGNASSTIAQVFNIPQGVSNAGPVASTKAIGDTLANIFQKDAPINQSTFLKERFFNDYAHFDTGVLSNTKNFAAWLLGVGDEVASKYIWNAQYRRALADGVPNPIKWADDQTRKSVQGRGIGEVPIAQQSKIVQLVAPFQLEVAGLWHNFADWARNDPSKLAMAEKLITFSVMSAIMNPIAKNLRGSDVSFDPIGAMMDSIDIYNQENDPGVGALKAGGRVAGEVISNIPGGSTLSSIMLSPTNSKKYLGDADPNRFGGGGAVALLGQGIVSGDLGTADGWKKTGIDLASKIALPFGGGQIKKTYDAASSLGQGYAENSTGKVMTPVEATPGNVIKGLLFGKNALGEVKNYYDTKQAPLSDQQTEKFKIAGNAVYDSVMGERASNNEKDALKAGKIPDTASATIQGIHRLSDGTFFVPNLSSDQKTFKTEQLAQLALQKEDFQNSSDNFRDLGEYVLRKKDDGTTYPQRKDVFTTQLLSAQMTGAKKNDNYEEWTKYADQKYQLLSKLVADPTVDDLDRAEFQNQMMTIEDDYAKYADYGGLKAGKKAPKLEEKYRYPLVDPEWLKIQSLIGTNTPKKFRMARKMLPLVIRRAPAVHRTTKR